MSGRAAGPALTAILAGYLTWCAREYRRLVGRADLERETDSDTPT
jgi:hypothetical protein